MDKLVDPRWVLMSSYG